MRTSFAHDAVLSMDGDADVRAPGAAITVALCGHWEHEPPCPLAPHHTAAVRAGDEVRLRILFAAEAELEDQVRRTVDEALAGGGLTGPEGVVTRWQLRARGPSVVRPEEEAHAGRLVAS